MQRPITETPAAEPRAHEPPATEAFAGDGTETVAVSFVWNEAEDRRWYRENERHSRPRIFHTILTGVMLLLIAVLIGLSAWLGHWSAPVIALVLALTFLLAFGRFGTPFVVARMFARRVPDVAHPFHLAVSPRGVHLATANTNGEVAWGGMQKVVETREFFLFFIGDRNSRYLPKRALSGDADVARVRAVVRRYGPPRQHLAG